MEAIQILEAIKSLSLADKRDIVKTISKDIQVETSTEDKEREQRTKAAQLLLPDYLHDKELTAFTALDNEDINESM